MHRFAHLPMMKPLFSVCKTKFFWQRGFTLIEVLVTLIIVSVAILSLGGFSLGVVSSGQVDRERITAVHFAEQVIEFWQHDINDYAPQISATCLFSPYVTAPAYPINPKPVCKPSSGLRINYTFNIEMIAGTAPLPTNPNANNSNAGSFSVRAMIGRNASNPTIKAVTVSWNNKGKTRSVFLTSMAIPK